jgi:F-type H+-transporting ATPase subunit a
MHEIGVRHVAQIAGFSFNMDTLYMTWLAMAVVIVIAILATRSLNVIPKGWQNVLEIIITGLQSQIDATMGERGKLVAPLLISLFMFILTSNWLGMIPTLSSPTSDLNTTLGLALMIVCMVHVLGLYFKGFSYIKHFFQPFAPFVIINLIEELAKPITLAFRLFGNILAGEILIIILLMLVPIWMPIPSVIWLAFSLFVGGVQAFIFTMLSMAYLASAVKQDNH